MMLGLMVQTPLGLWDFLAAHASSLQSASDLAPSNRDLTGGAEDEDDEGAEYACHVTGFVSGPPGADEYSSCVSLSGDGEPSPGWIMASNSNSSSSICSSGVTSPSRRGALSPANWREFPLNSCDSCPASASLSASAAAEPCGGGTCWGAIPPVGSSPAPARGSTSSVGGSPAGSLPVRAVPLPPP